MFHNPLDPEQLLRRHPGGQRRHRGAGLGVDAAAHVPALLRAQGLHGRGARGIARRSGGHQERVDQGRRRIRVRLPAHRDRRAPARAQESRSTRTRGGIRRSRACSSIPKWTSRSRSTSIRPTCASTPTAPRAPAASTSTRPTPRCASRTCPTNIVVQCQNDRSQHRNRAEAMAMLKSKLYELELRKRQERAGEARGLEDRHRLGPPDPLVRARPVAHQGPAHQRRGRQHAGGARRRPRRFHRGEPEAGSVDVRRAAGPRRKPDHRRAPREARSAARARPTRFRTTSAATHSPATCMRHMTARTSEALEANAASRRGRRPHDAQARDGQGELRDAAGHDAAASSSTSRTTTSARPRTMRSSTGTSATSSAPRARCSRRRPASCRSRRPRCAC